MSKVFGNAQWIGLGEGSDALQEIAPAYCYRKELYLQSTHKLTCLVCGLGYYTLYINGVKVGDSVLTPDYTAYDKRVYYNEYDIESYVKIGKNLIAVEVGNGFYNQTAADEWHFHYASWRNTPRLILSVTDGEKQLLCTDSTWKCGVSSATYHTNVRTGEYYNALYEDWNKPETDDSTWGYARVVRPCGGLLEKSFMPPPRECEILDAVTMVKTENGYLYDFGKIVSGYCRLSLKSIAGNTVSIRYGEKIKNGTLDQSNLDFYVDTKSFSEDRYTFKGSETEIWNPKYVYHGFRYALLTGDNITPDINSLKGVFVHTDLRKIGSFDCSDKLLNWIYDASVRSLLCNFTGILQDCPHREKNGWTGDEALSAPYAAFNFDCASAFLKITKDICDTQRPSGQICAIAPTSGWGYNWGTGPAWDYALFALPKVCFDFYGDTRAVEYMYPYGKKYLEYARQMETEGTVCYGIGDWCSPTEIKDKKIVPTAFSDSCYYLSIVNIMSEFAALLGKADDCAEYKQKAKSIKKAVQSKFIKDGVIANGSQGALAHALYFGIAEGDAAKECAKRLAEDLAENNYVFHAGVLSLNAMLCSLSEYGYTDTAYKVVTRKGYPSFDVQREAGSTALWETFEGKVSLCHHMFGFVNHWMTTYIAGLRMTECGYKSCVLNPFFYDKNCFCSAETQTPYGKIGFQWKKEDKMLTVSVTVPEQIKCTLVLSGKEICIKTGQYSFEI